MPQIYPLYCSRSFIYLFLFSHHHLQHKTKFSPSNDSIRKQALIDEDLKQVNEVFVERWSLHRGYFCNKYASVICHLLDITITCFLHRGGLQEVVFRRWSFIKGCLFASSCDCFSFPVSLSTVSIAHYNKNSQPLVLILVLEIMAGYCVEVV